MTRKEIYETELPHRAVAVYLYLETRADRERTCYPAIGTIARELHLSVSTVKRAIRDLECAGFIQKKQRSFHIKSGALGRVDGGDRICSVL